MSWRILSRSRVLLCAAVVLLALSGCSDGWSSLLASINTARQASNGSLQAKRALLISEDGLARLAHINAVAAVSAADTPIIDAAVLEAVNQDASLQERGVSIDSVSITFADQTITVQAAATARLGVGEATASLTGDASVAASGGTLYLQLFFHDALLVGFKPRDTDLTVDTARPELESVLGALTGLANIAFDHEVNARHKLALGLGNIDLFTGDMTDLNSGGLAFQPRTVSIAWHAAALGVLVRSGGLVVAADLSPSPQGDVALELSDPLSVSDAAVKQRISAFQTALGDKIHAAFDTDLQAQHLDLVKLPTMLAVKKDLLAASFTQAAASPEICASAQPKVDTSRQDIDVAMTFTGERKCDSIKRNCEYKDFCNDPGRCERKVMKPFTEITKVPQQVIDKVCHHIPLGDLICDKVFRTVYVDVPTTVMKEVTELVDSPICNTIRATPGLCEVASNTDKALCDIAHAPEDALCVAEQGLLSFAEHNPVATAHVSLGLAPSIDACLKGTSVDPTFSLVSTALSASVHSPVHVGIDWKNHAPVVCAFDWSEGFDFDASAAFDGKQLQLTIEPPTILEDQTLRLGFRYAEDKVAIDLDKSPLDEIFIRHPQITVNCPLLAAAGLVYGSYDTIANEKFKALSGAFTGKGIDIPLKAGGFSVDIKPVHAKLGKNDLVLLPKWGDTSILLLHQS